MEFLQREKLHHGGFTTERPLTPLRQRMLDDMAMRSMGALGPSTTMSAASAPSRLSSAARRHGECGGRAAFPALQREHGVGESTMGATVSALRFLFDVTLERPDLSRKLVADSAIIARIIPG